MDRRQFVFGSAGLGLDYDWLLQQRFERGRERPPDDVDRPARWERIDEGHRTDRIVLRERRCRDGRCGGAGQE